MVQRDDLVSISNDDLLTTAQRLTARANVALADLLSHLGEIERRGIHRLRACASLYTYWIFELRMSEDAAYRRSKAARLVREYPSTPSSTTPSRRGSSIHETKEGYPA